ncbi:ERC protein 2-like isoform X2 [Babylonia areolata]|uniref:ERC protein 2-like isoform X2 n=1 Tax=Babylonia areolata TaxID=304850 RepID=UPI003FD038C1
MPEFKLKKMFSKSRSSSRHRMDSEGGDVGTGNMNGGGPMSSHPGTSPEHHGPGASSSRYGSRSSLTGGSMSGNGSKSNSLERRSRTGSDGGISGISGMDSGHSSMNSPLNLPMEHLQSFNATYGGGQRTYLESLSIPRQLSSQVPPKSALSPTHHARSSHFSHGHHARTNSATSLSTTALRDRSIDRLERDVVYSTDRSLDRHLDRMQSLSAAIDNQRERNQRTYNRDRSLDREYPHMGARSLEREHSSVPRSRSSDRSGEMNYPMPPFITSSPSPQDYRNNLIFELQCQVTELHQECAKLQKEVEVARDKLGSSMNSIKTFWSPELKKERSMRKEESAKCNMLNEQLKVTQAELKRHRDLFHDLGGKFGTGEGAEVIAAANASELESLRNEKESQGKEMLILRRTVDELEIRIETQKQTLAARDASIKTLLDMLQGKGLPVNQLEDDRREMESLQSQAAQDASKIRQLEAAVEARDAEISKLSEESARLRSGTDASSLSVDLSASSSSSHTLNAMIEAKDARIAALEREVQSLEDKLLKSKEELTMDDRRDLSKDSPGVKDRQQRLELQSLKDEMGRKEREYASLQLQAETLKRQHEETLHHVTVLKEQLAAKEKQTTMLQADIEGLQERLKNKDGTIERKSKESQAVASDKRRLETEVAELKDQLDTKERKITVLQRKVETQEDLIKEKEETLSQVKARQMFTDSTDSAVSSLEESITEKDRQIERLREMREQSDRDHQEELDLYVKTNQDLKTQMEAMHFELTAKQTELCELREEAAELRAQKFQADAKMRQLEAAAQESTTQSSKEVATAEMQTDPVQDSDLWTSAGDPSSMAEGPQVNGGEEDGGEAPAPNLLEELQKKVSELEEDKKEKEAQITDMQDVIKEYRQKVGTLKRNQQTEKKKNAQLLEEARKREDSFTDDASQLSTTIEQKNERIEELEEALRESVRITAQREMDMVELQSQIDSSKSAMEDMRKEVEGMQASSREYTSKLATLTRQLEDRDAKLKRMGAERQKHLEEVYEMKQEAVQAAISEKDSTIALLEMTSTKKQRNLEEIEQLTHEKHRLQATLREVTQNLMKLREGGEKAGSETTTPTSTAVSGLAGSGGAVGSGTGSSGSSSKGKKTVAQRLRNAPPEQVVRVIRKLEHSKKRLRTLVEKLQTVCNDTDPSLLEGVSSPVMGPAVDFANLRSLSLEQLLLEALRSEDESRSLQGQANFMLQRLGTRAPELLQAFLAILDSSDTDSCTSCQSN